MIKRVKNIGLIFVLISTAVLTGRFFFISRNNDYLFCSEFDNSKGIEQSLYLFKPFYDEVKLASNKKDFKKAIKILKELNIEIDNSDLSLKQKKIYKAKNFNLIAKKYKNIGLYVNAESFFLKSAKIYDELPFKDYYKNSIFNNLNLSNLYISLYEYEKAAEPILQSKYFIKKEFNKDIYENYLLSGELANILLLQNNLKYSETLLELAILGLNKCRERYPYPLIDNYKFSLASVYLGQRKYEYAESILRELLENKNNQKDKIYNLLSKSLSLQGEFDEAEEIATELLKKNEKKFIDDNNKEILSSLANLAYIYQQQKLHDKSLEYTKRILNPKNKNAFNSLRRELQSSIINNSALSFLALGLYNESENLFKLVLELNNTIYKKDSHFDIQALKGLAMIYASKGEYKKSSEYSYKALAQIFESMQNLIQGMNIAERYKFVNDEYNQFHLFPFTLVDTYDSYKNIALFSRLNNQGLLQEIESRQNKLNSYAGHNKWRKELKLIEGNLSSNKSLNSPKFREQLFLRKAVLEKALNLSLPRINPKVVNIQEIAKVIPRSAVLIEYQKYDVAKKEPFKNLKRKEKYLALILSPDGNISSFDLGSAEVIESKIEEAINTTILKKDNSMKKWREVSDLIIKPLTEEINQKDRLIISPDSALNKVAYSALGSPLSENLLNDDFQVNLITAGRDLLDINQANSHKSSMPIVIANPDFGKLKSNIRRFKNIKSDFYKRTETEILEYELELKGTASQSWKPLPFSKQEGEDIKEIINAQLFMNKEAKSSLIFEKNISPKIIHIASHSFYHDAYYDSGIEDYNKNPLNRSGIVFAGANLNFENDNDDGFLTALEISRIDLRGTELFVVSGCESAMGDLRIGEGIYGLKRSIAVAGAQSSLLSLWNIRDDSTAIFMTSFYKRLKKGESKSEALYSTQRDFREGKIKSSNPELYDWSKPFYWAPFQLSGDWKSIEL